MVIKHQSASTFESIKVQWGLNQAYLQC